MIPQPSNLWSVPQPSTLVLAGTAGKGIYILGALFRIDPKGIDTYIGVSSGSMICFLLSCGFRPYEIYQKLLKYDNPFFANIVPSVRHGILNTNSLFQILQELFCKINIDLQVFTFEDHLTLTQKHLLITAYNISMNREEVFSAETSPEMKIIDAIRLSIGIPVLFGISEYNEDTYIDGALWNNIPINYSKTKSLAIVINKKVIPTPNCRILSIHAHRTLTPTLASSKLEKILMFFIGYLEASNWEAHTFADRSIARRYSIS